MERQGQQKEEIDFRKLEVEDIVSPNRITLGFSSHHIEVLPFMRCQMELHRAVILEEPPSALFPEMLAGLITAEDYLMEADSQFPQFDCQMCGLIREMHREGKQIFQVEPYLEMLIRIHELLAAGKTKEDVKAMPALKEVYEAESMASGALITFYSTSARPFRRRFGSGESLRQD